MFFLKHIFGLHENSSVASVKAFLKLLVHGPSFRSIKKYRLQTCPKELDFQVFRNAKGPHLLQLDTS